MAMARIIYYAGVLVGILVAVQYVSAAHAESRSKRQTASTLTVRNCEVYPPDYPGTTFLSDVRITELRRQMRNGRFNYQAYIIPGYDSHGSEYPADPDKRIWYMTGFNGTGGVAIVTMERAAVWTEKRFELLAKQQIDCNWDVMVLDDNDYLTPWQWLLREYDLDQQELLAGELRGAGLENGARVGFDPLLMPYGYWYELQETNILEPRTIDLSATPVPNPESQTLTSDQLQYNLVDRTRIELAGRLQTDPSNTDETFGNNPRDPYGLQYPGVELFIQDRELYAGYYWQDKIFRRRQTSVTSPILYFKTLREIMSEKDVDMLVVTKLDEIAWLFNLRGEDIPYNPLFISYAIIGTTYINLYLYEANRRLDAERYPHIREHLELESSRCQGASSPTSCVTARDISSFPQDLKTLHSSSKIWFSNSTNYYVYDAVVTRVNGDRRRYLIEPSPILLMKAVKNDVEIAAMKKAFIADSVTAIEVGAWMDDILQNQIDPKVGDERSLTEWMVAEKTETFREGHTTYQYPSYETISAVGPNSADYYYHPIEEARVAVPTGKMFLYDIGGQYREGTTTLSRTFYFAIEKYRDNENENRYNYDRAYDPSIPTDFQKEVYTRVVMGLIDLSNTTFQSNVYGRDLDAVARQYLWQVGLDYFHPTGYGVGQYLNVHEGPVFIDMGYTLDEQPFNRSMFVSVGPGYYYRDPDGNRENDFGVRVTNVLQVVRIDPQYEELNEDEDDDVQYLKFETVSLVPFEPRLIKFEYFTRKQLTWYNEYNKKINNELGNRLSGTARRWLERRTRFQKYRWEYIGGAPSVSRTTTAIIVTVCSIVASLVSRI